MTRVSLLFIRAKYVIENEGFIALIKKALSFIGYQLFFYRRYYLYETMLNETDKSTPVPEAEDFSLRVITTNQQVGELTDEGFEFKHWYPIYTVRLDKGAVAFCGFIGKELVHVSWCVLTTEAMKSLGEPPFKVNFLNKETASGDYWTNSKYRRLGIAHYASRLRQQYSRDNDRVIERGAIAKQNLRAQHVFRNPHNRSIHTERWYLKILGWQLWKETPLISPGLTAKQELNE